MKNIITEIKQKNQYWITLNDPEKMNALGDQLIDSLVMALQQAESSPEIRVIVIQGAGSAFSAGGDVKAMLAQQGMFQGSPTQLRQNYIDGIQRIPKTIETLSKPLIAMVNGVAVGAGCDLAMMCDLRIGSEKTKIGETFVKVGLISGDGGNYFLTRALGYAKAMEMTLTGDIYGGEQALQFGLLHRMVPSENLVRETEQWAQKISENAPLSVRLSKQGLKAAYHNHYLQILELAATQQGLMQRTSDHQEALMAFMEKRPPQFRGE